MKTAYFDCVSGVSGDMALAALIDAGADLEAIREKIDSLGAANIELRVEEVRRRGFRAAKLIVEHEPEPAHRHLSQIRDLIGASSLTPPQQELALRIFQRIGEAEAKVHGVSLEKVHFHEVGAIDSIVDICGFAVAYDLLGIDQLVCSAVPTGQGTITIAHGPVSVPAPATAELLAGVPLAPSSVEAELTTPTGAAIVAETAVAFGPLPAMKISKIGYGAGERQLKEQANVLRVLLGDTEDAPRGDEILILETHVDDAPGEIIGYTIELLLENGALDAYSSAIAMKKNRPGVLITVLCRPDTAHRLEDILLRETTTLGVRRSIAQRRILPREMVTVETPWGEVEGKVAWLDEKQRFSPEYESCKKLAAEHSVALKEIYAAARAAFAGR